MGGKKKQNKKQAAPVDDNDGFEAVGSKKAGKIHLHEKGVDEEVAEDDVPQVGDRPKTVSGDGRHEAGKAARVCRSKPPCADK